MVTIERNGTIPTEERGQDTLTINYQNYSSDSAEKKFNNISDHVASSINSLPSREKIMNKYLKGS
jgi:hypothetical protein